MPETERIYVSAIVPFSLQYSQEVTLELGCPKARNAAAHARVRDRECLVRRAHAGALDQPRCPVKQGLANLVARGRAQERVDPSEKKVLIEMLANPGKTYSREEIGKISGISQERSIDVMITRLRQKIEINPKNPKYLQTIRGSGYVLWIE